MNRHQLAAAIDAEIGNAYLPESNIPATWRELCLQHNHLPVRGAVRFGLSEAASDRFGAGTARNGAAAVWLDPSRGAPQQFSF
jgi:hypothetical protein